MNDIRPVEKPRIVHILTRQEYVDYDRSSLYRTEAETKVGRCASRRSAALRAVPIFVVTALRAAAAIARGR